MFLISFVNTSQRYVRDLRSSKLVHFHVPEVNAATLKPTLREPIDKAAMAVTGEPGYHSRLRAVFPAGHFTAQHNMGKYIRGNVDKIDV
jgi:hypothetical protein